MNRKSTPPSIAELLQHAAWTRQLARGLVGTDAAAEDAVQETWIAALRRPPETTQPVRPWLGAVLRNKVFNRSRENARRDQREGRADAREAPESAESLLGRLEMHRILVEVVSALPEPYRQTVLLAYFEELTSAEIGERHDLPASTVRGRLKTALELLREALDSRLGSRAAWLLPATDLSRPLPAPPRAGSVRVKDAASPRSASSSGAAGGNALLPAVVGVLAVAATAAVVWTAARKPSVSSAETSSSTTAAGAPSSVDDDTPLGTPSASGSPVSHAAGEGSDRPARLATREVDRVGGPLPALTNAAVRGFVVAGGPEARRAAPRLGRGGVVSGAVVRIIGAPSQASATLAPGGLHIERGRFVSRLGIVPAATPVELRNDDDTPHLVRMTRADIELFKGSIPEHQMATLAVPSGDAILKLELLDAAGAAAFIAPTENGFAAVTDGGGNFVLKDVPRGRYTLEVWDEALGTKTADVTVPLAEPWLRVVFGEEPPAELTYGKGDCKIAVREDWPIAKACGVGGRGAAMKLMKNLVRQARGHGDKFACDGCHNDIDDFTLTAHARDDFERLLASAQQRP
jgi:RNA polymerase sigma-70 factor (ECF subfamily)